MILVVLATVIIAIAILIFIVIVYMIIAILATILATPTCALKEEQVQTGSSYNVDDVKGVGGKQKSIETEKRKKDF